MNMLLVAQSSAHQPDIINNTHSALHTKISSRNLQAAAVASLTSNFIAATDLSSCAGQTLDILCMTVQPELTAEASPWMQHSLALAQQQHQQINQSTFAPIPHTTNNNTGNPPYLPLIPNLNQLQRPLTKIDEHADPPPPAWHDSRSDMSLRTSAITH
ncbi:hypothetical protein PGT21_029333 [Puccinia graminis f. sp. tritici]|uniref:Uncharacterized protein n=1 Tax=Puccinia graminis f. sp. tritici TaxID=56615 RepID=A0A5B0PGH0_PUCGR|nr:hypothetical protein PGT21_029333 [Puccinia graminis f. sp. tritici]